MAAGQWSAAPSGEIEAAWDTATAHTGNASLKLGYTKANWSGWFESPRQYTAVKPGDRIEAQVWAKTENATGSTYLSLDWYASGKPLGRNSYEQLLGGLRVVGGAPFGSNPHVPNPIRGAHDWTKLIAVTFVPKGADQVRIGLRSEGNGSGWAWFDDVALRVVPPEELLGELDRNPILVDHAALAAGDYATVKDGHLWHRGKRLRVWSAQGSLLAETHAHIDFEVARFKQHGFNGHRTLWWWKEVTDNYTPGDRSTQDLRDYLIARLGQEGIFVWFDILNSCRIGPEMVDVIDDPKTADAWQAAMKQWLGKSDSQIMRWASRAAVFDPRIQKIYHNYIRRVLAHRNP